MSMNAQLPIMTSLAVSKSPVHWIYNIRASTSHHLVTTFNLPSFGILN